MSAKKTGGTTGRLREKNSRMAAMLKQKGIQRKTCNCPICHHLVSLDKIDNHTMTCQGRRK